MTRISTSFVLENLSAKISVHPTSVSDRVISEAAEYISVCPFLDSFYKTRRGGKKA